MKPIVITLSNATAGALFSAPIVLDVDKNPFNVAMQVLVTGAVVYSVQYTFDNVFATGYNPLTGNWTTHPQLSALTVTADSNLTFPAVAVRITQASGSGSVRLTTIQAG
jgi:hypothetical protein